MKITELLFGKKVDGKMVIPDALRLASDVKSADLADTIEANLNGTAPNNTSSERRQERPARQQVKGLRGQL